MDSFFDKLHETFIVDDRWKYLVNGLKTTLIITVFAVMIGMLLGFLVAIVRSTHDRTGRFKILNLVCKLYLTVIRGTPVMVQLLIIYYVIFVYNNPIYLINKEKRRTCRLYFILLMTF